MFNNNFNNSLVLASSSITRSKLLRRAGMKFVQESSNIDESLIKKKFQSNDNDPMMAAEALARAKAKAVGINERFSGLKIVAADQILVCDDEWFNKPLDIKSARIQLKKLRGKKHHLYTATCITCSEKIIWDHKEVAQLTMHSFDDSFLDVYLNKAGTKILNTVGAYQLEGLGSQLFSRIEGDFFTILGLPLIPLLNFLRLDVKRI